MEESDSSGSDVERQTKLQETQHMDQKMDSDESYSDSDSDETKQPKSMYNVYKTGHVPGKYKQSIEPEADQPSARETHEGFVANFDANKSIQVLEEDGEKNNLDACGLNDDKEEDIQVSPHLTTRQEVDFTETGIFEKSMLVIPSMPMDDAEEKKIGEKAMLVVRPPIPPKPMVDVSFSLEPVDVASPNSRPKPAPRKSKRISEAYSDDKVLQIDYVQQNSPLPPPRPKRKSEEVELPLPTENEKTISPDGSQTKINTTDIESNTFMERSESSDSVEIPEKKAKVDLEKQISLSLIDTVDIGSASQVDTEDTEDYTYVLGTDDTLISDTVMKDMVENVGSQQPATRDSFEETKTGGVITDSEMLKDFQKSDMMSEFPKDDSDTENEENATFENDFQDTDSAKDDLNNEQNISGSESDGPFRTPDNRSDDDDYEYYDSNAGLQMHSHELLDSELKAENAESSETNEFDEDKTNSEDKYDIDKTSEIKTFTDFEESLIVIGKGTVKETGYVSISSTVTSSELNSVDKTSVEQEEAKPASVRDRISAFENIGQENNTICGNTNTSNFEKSSSSSIEVLSRDNSEESPLKTDVSAEGFDLQADIEETFEMRTDKSDPPPVGPMSDSLRSIVILSTKELQNESLEKEHAIGYIDQFQCDDVRPTIHQEVDNSEDSEKDILEDEEPPPVPPKSELVLESMRSYVVEDPPNVSPRSLAFESNSNLTDLDINSPNHDNTGNNTDPGMTGTQQSSSLQSEQFTLLSAAEEREKPVLHEDYEQPQFPTYQHQQHQMPPYSNMQYPQQQQPAPMWGQYYYTDEMGNVPYVNPYAFYNPNMNPGMFNQAPNMQYYQQPQFYSHQMYGTGNAQIPNRDAGYSSHQYTRPEDDQYDEVGQVASEEHRRSGSQVDHRQSPMRHQRSASQKTDGTKLTKSKSAEPIKETVTEERSSSPHVRRSMLTPTTSHGKPGRSKDNKRKQAEDVVEENEELSKQIDYHIYFKGINPDTKKENLSNFIEVTTKGETNPENIIFNHSRTCALVTVSLNQKPDMSKVEERIHKRGIDGQKPEVYEVQPPDSIAVSCDEDVKSTESLGLYFESRKAGDADLKQDPYESEDGSCYVIQYGDPDVVKKVCARQTPHIWEGRKLRVSPYFECKAGGIWDSELHVVKIPEPIVVSLQNIYLQLLQRDCCKQLLANLESKYCLPTFTDKGLQLECTLTPKTPGFRGLVKDWEAVSRRMVDTYISENVHERTLQSSEEVWKELITFFKSENFQERTDLVISVVDSSFVILLVGFRDPVTDVFTKLDENRKEIEKRLRRITETIRFDTLKLRLLGTVGVFEEVKQETDDIDIYIGDGEITFEGQPDDISTVRVRMYEAENKISQSKLKHGFSRDFVDFITRKLTNKLTAILKRSNITAEWQIDERDIIVYAFEAKGAAGSGEDDYEEIGGEDNTHSNVDDVSTNADLLKSAIVEMEENVEDSIIEVVTSPEWTSYLESVTEEYENVAEVEFKEMTGKLIMYGMKKEAHELHSKVKDFIEENAVKEDTLKCGTINVRFMNMHRSELAATLEKKFERFKVRIVMNDESVIIRGTKAGIAETKKEFSKFFNSIICEKYTIQKVAVKDVFRDAKDQGTIDVVEKETKCLIKLPGENATFMLPASADGYSEDSDDGYEVPVNVKGTTGSSKDGYGYAAAAPPPAHHRDQGFKAPNGVKVTLVKGELGQQDGDVIVVTTSPNLNMSSGNACKSVLKAGGQRLQDECKERYPNDIKFGEIADIHGGGSLECNRVYLTTLPNWTSENNPRQILEKVMKDSLELASKHKKHSILFCAMGTGQLKYPIDLVAMLMYQAVIDFDQNNPQTTLKDVRFVLYQKDFPTIKGFEAEERLRLEGGGERPTFDLKYGNVMIELSVENIAQQKVDGILCSTSPNMDLSRNGACQALLRSGGKSLQDECKSKYNNTLTEGQVVEIGGGKLPCKFVFLTVLPGFSADAIGILTKVIQTLLGLAQSKNLTSLALPALGTGFLKYPKDEVCKCMFETVRDWVHKNPTTTIKTVRFIMHAKDHGVIQRFKSYIVNAKGRGKRESRHFVKDPKEPPKITTALASHKSEYNAHEKGVQVGKIKLSVFKDDVLSQKTEAIVSSVGNDFEFLGAVAQELKKKFPKMETECHRKEQKQKLHSEGVVVTRGFGLPVKAVIHVKFADSLTTWQERIYKCLEKVNKQALKSVAFPVLGTGSGFRSFSPDAIAGCMFDAIHEFVQLHKNPSVKDIRLIVYKGQPAMFDPIMDKLHKKVQEAAVSSKDPSWKRMISKTVKKIGNAIGLMADGVMSEEERKKLMELTSSMDVHIYSDNQINIDNCKKELDAKLEKVYTKRKIDEYKEVIKSLTQEEMKILDIVALANINIDRQAGIITVDGPMKQVSDVTHELQAKLLKIERRRHDTNAAEELFKLVQWQYEEVTQTEFKLVPYSKPVNQLIEKAYKANTSNFEFEDDDGDIFVIDFQQLIEYRKLDDQDKLRVVRKDILKSAASALPEEWAPMKDNENIKVVSVPATDQSYKDIEQRFITEVKTGSYSHRLNFDPNKMQVNKIERIQNKTLYQQYQAKRKQMTEQKPNLPQNMPIERELWHGTKSDAVTSIQMHGFNRSYSGDANGKPWYGDGVYFAGNASYSARGWLSGAGSGSKGYMFVVKTLTGQFCKGQQGMRYLPAVDPKNPTLLYDCAVDDPANPLEFVIFNDTQAYPAYIITFTT